MLKKILIMMSLLTMATITKANPLAIQDGIQYKIINKKPPTNVKNEVIEFFSFVCGACYGVEMQGGIKVIKENLPQDAKLLQYTISDNDALNTTWSVASQLGLQESYAKEIFNGFFVAKTLTMDMTEKDLVPYMERAGISKQTFESMKHHPNVIAFKKRQQQLIDEIKPSFTPYFVVNEKYDVIPDKLSQDSYAAYFADLSRVINYLLTLK